MSYAIDDNDFPSPNLCYYLCEITIWSSSPFVTTMCICCLVVVSVVSRRRLQAKANRLPCRYGTVGWILLLDNNSWPTFNSQAYRILINRLSSNSMTDDSFSKANFMAPINTRAVSSKQ